MTKSIYQLRLILICLVTVLPALSASALAAESIGKWRRHVVTLPNNSYSGNPFELEVNATFTHIGTGTELTLPGYYAGNGAWKIGFMPTLIGDWTYTTSSTDADLNRVTGAVTSVRSNHPGMLKADTRYPKKWKFTDGPYVVPIGLQFSVMLEETSISGFAAAANFLADEVKGRLFNFRLSPNDIAFDDVGARTFDLSLWDRLEQRMEILTQRGLGVSVMLYTDDSGRPGFGGRSSAEALLIRYTVARLAGYPSVFFNTGIDIAEYRSSADVDWIGVQLAALDPYDHPRSSRYGGGSGGSIMAARNFDSHGSSTAPIGPLVTFFESADGIPVSVDDNWGEQFSRGNFSPSDIRRAFWKITVAGGLGSHVRDDTKTDFPNANDEDAWFHATNMASKLESEQWLGLINPFVENKLGTTFGAMVPAPSLASGNGAYCLADSARTKLLYFLVGANDKFDAGGGDVTARLAGVSADFTATWFDPRTGQERSERTLAGGANHIIVPPSQDDWVLLLSRTTGADTVSPAPPTDLDAL